MKIAIIFSIIVLWLPCALIYAQPPESFFPHHVGDTWQYTLDNTNIIYSTDIIVADSTDSAGTVYLKYEGEDFYRHYIDTSYNVYTSRDGGLSYFYYDYKLDAEIGESWLWVPPQSLDSIRAKVVGIYPDILFGISTTVKEFEYWMFLSPIDSLWLATRFLTSDFGLIAFWGEPGPRYHLTGAIIDSVQYGIIVGINEPQNQPILPMVVELYQNYPNPFNPATTIQYQLNSAARVVLEVYNSLGQKVNTLVSEPQPTGIYQIHFDGSNLPSGIYYYRIEADGYAQQKKMLLIK